jgi:hypothetical protein
MAGRSQCVASIPKTAEQPGYGALPSSRALELNGSFHPNLPSTLTVTTTEMGGELPDRFQISISTKQTLAFERHSTAPDH